VSEVFDDMTIRYLHGGCSLLVGSVSPDGRPHAGRAWGLTVVDNEHAEVRLLLNVNDTTTVANLQPGAAVAICTADVETLRSLQVKGRVLAVEQADEADIARQQRYTAEFTGDVHRTDGEPMEKLLRWADCSVIACVIALDEAFDQTPGPSAGARVQAATS
jgi:hypothetical protein